MRTPVIHSQQAPPPPTDFGPSSSSSGGSGSSGPSSGGGKAKGGGFELLPWSELSSGQRMGRGVFAAVALLLILFFIRGILRGLVSSSSGTSGSVPAADSSAAPITEGDRKDGIDSLCKVFQIYGLPKSDNDATEDARNAGELFKLAGNQSPERSKYILTSIVAEFRAGKLGQNTCSDAGEPLPTNESTPDNSAPDVQRDSGRP